MYYQRTILRYLPWSYLEEIPSSFDLGTARIIVAKCLDRLPRLQQQDSCELMAEYRLENEIDCALQSAFGPWIAGWCWGKEPSGGPIEVWFASGLRTDPTSRSVERVISAILEWREFLHELAGELRRIREETKELGLAQSVERAAGVLLAIIIHRTAVSDAWYGTFIQVLNWYLEATGVPQSRIDTVLTKIVSGRFDSWTAPDDDTANATCADIGRAVANCKASYPEQINGTATWVAIRAKAFRLVEYPPERTQVEDDSHQRYINQRDALRAPQRAKQMSLALAQCRAAAQRGNDLTFKQLAAWQATALQQPNIAFRRADAFAKDGHERYPFASNTRAHFTRLLAEANDMTTRVCIRAARVYLDICFFHPFEDGNGRAARLALEYVLAREGLALHAAEPIFILASDPSDVQGACYFADILDHLIGIRPKDAALMQGKPNDDGHEKV
jgi:hypothetical protein